MNSTNPIWKFFSSVQLAIFTLVILSLTSIIGTIIPQGRSFEFYIEKYGTTLARFFHILDIPEMYTSWWFLTLLGLLSVNLVVCSIDRLPLAIGQITLDQTGFDSDRLRKMAFTHEVANPPPSLHDHATELLRKKGWKLQKKATPAGQITAAQKGGWSRTGVYIVHLSILVIFAGAIIGHLLGFKGSVLIPEMKDSDKVYGSKTHTPIDLGFTVRCERFDIEFYDNGMPKEYRSRLTVIENGEEKLVKDIEVNDPLIYRGITFYQSSYEPYRDFIIRLSSTGSAPDKILVAPFQQQVDWQATDISVGIVNAEAIRERVSRMKVWVRHGNNEPVTFWVTPAESYSLLEHGLQYTIEVKQMYATGLQVAKDPGVWVVYLGFFLMMAGLYIAFFLSHQRIWLLYETDTSGNTTLGIAGTTNKNKLGFEKVFTSLVDDINRAGT